MSCKKITDKKYLTRSSPPYHANDCKYKTMDGNDKKSYVSRPDKNKSFKWYPVKLGKTPEEYFEQFQERKIIKKYVFPSRLFTLLEKDLMDNEILLFNIKWNESSTFVDELWYHANTRKKKSAIYKDRMKHDKENTDNKVVSMIFYSEYGKYNGEKNGKIYLQHGILRNDKQKVIEIFEKHFGKDFKWTEKINDVIIIKLHKKLK